MRFFNNNKQSHIVSQNFTRREFFKRASRYGMILGSAGVTLSAPLWLRQLVCTGTAAQIPSTTLNSFIREAPIARYWISTHSPGVQCLSCHSVEENIENVDYEHSEVIIKCLLCAQGCIIREGERGVCRTRAHVDGKLRSLVYGRPISVHVDPIEKKPLYHFRPGSRAFSIATAGCPLKCKFCQNWEISQARPEDFRTQFVPPQTIVQATEQRSASVIAFTYNEPTVFTEYLTDIARIARKQDVYSALISCGFMNEEPLGEMCDVLDAIKIDLKGFCNDFYRRVCDAELEPVLRSIQQVARRGVHLEIVNLVVPTLNDSKRMLTELAKWVFGEVGPDVPIHFTRFHPDYKMLNLPPTPIATLEQAYEIAKTEGVHYPYVGNVPGHRWNNTYCPVCGKVVVSRTGFFITAKHLRKGRCEYCNAPIAGVWD